jgi:hypothetical protein
MEEIRKLNLEGYKLKENARNDPKKIVTRMSLNITWQRAGTFRRCFQA